MNINENGVNGVNGVNVLFMDKLENNNQYNDETYGKKLKGRDLFYLNVMKSDSGTIHDIDQGQIDDISPSNSINTSESFENDIVPDKRISIHSKQTVTISPDGEPKLMNYINNNFINKINEFEIHNVDYLNDVYDDSNSPLTMSNENSDNEIEEGNENDDFHNDFDIHMIIPNETPKKSYELFRDNEDGYIQPDDSAHAVDVDDIEDLNLQQNEISQKNNRYVQKSLPIHTINTISQKQKKDCHRIQRCKMLSYKDIERTVDKYYETDDKQSSEVDILLTYLRGQKNIYLQSKNVFQSKLNGLMIPTILFSAAIAVMTPFIQQYEWSGAIITGINGITALFITIIRYYKLESSVEIFNNISNQYDHLETSLEMTSNKLLFNLESIPNHKLYEKIRDIEKKISEIKESITIHIPYEIKRIFPIICHINIFSFIKRIETNKKNIMLKFKDIKNEIRYIVHHSKTGNYENDVLKKKRQQNRLKYLLDIKHKIKEELFHYKNAYNYIDHLFTREINHADRIRFISFYYFFSYKKIKNTKITNPIINEYLEFIFNEND
jgi:hypothetical protein